MTTDRLTTCKILDIITQKHGLTTDYQVGKVLQVKSSQITYWRKGGIMSDALCIARAASLIDTDCEVLIYCLMGERSDKEGKPDVADYFYNYAKKLAGNKHITIPRIINSLSACFVCVLSFFLMPR